MSESCNDPDKNNPLNTLARMRLFLSPHAEESAAEVPPQKSDDSTDSILQHQSDLSKDKIVSAVNETKEIVHQDTPKSPRSQKVSTRRPSVGSVPLDVTSKEYLRVKYLLQASLPTYKVVGNPIIWDMRNPALFNSFEQNTSGFLKLDSWAGVHDLDPSNAMKDVYSGEFSSVHSETGMKFATGNLIMETSHSKGSKRIVLCKVAVGKSFIVESEEEALKPLTHGYNSYYIKQGSETDKRKKKKNSKGYYHEYIIKNQQQVLPHFLVDFDYETFDVEEANRCALCERKKAVLKCKTCEAVLCLQCDDEVHSANKLVSRHQRLTLKNTFNQVEASSVDDSGSKTLQINESIKIDSCCEKHPDVFVEFYCPTCVSPVCVHCKMVGDHSCGEATSHRLLSITDAYVNGIKEANKGDALIESRRDIIHSRLKLLENRRDHIKKNNFEVRKAIEEAAAAAIKELDEKSKEKWQVLEGQELELKRQLEHIEWAEGYLIQQKNTLNPVEFLESWKQHKKLRTELRDFPVTNVPSANNIKGDIQLFGQLKVMLNDDFSPSDLLSEYNMCKHCASSQESENHITNQNIRKKLLSISSSECNAFSKYYTAKEGSGYDDLKNYDHSPLKRDSNKTSTIMISPKGHELIAKVKEEISKGQILGTNGKQFTGKKKYSDVQNIVTSTLRGVSASQTTKVNIHQRRKTCDLWTSQLRLQMGLEPHVDKNALE